MIYIYVVPPIGFMKEQLKVSTEDRNIIRVHGECLIAGNKWSRFEEDFQVPDNSKLTSVRAKHDGRTLTITIPRKNVGAGKVTLSPLPKAEDQVLPPKITDMKSPKEPGRDQGGQDKITPAIGSSKPITDGRSSESAPRTKIGRQEDERKSHMEKDKSPELTEKPAAQENIVDKVRKEIVDDKSLEPLGIKRMSGDKPNTRIGQQEDEEKAYIEKQGTQHIATKTAPWKDNVGKGKEITEDREKIKSEKISKKHHHKIDKSSTTDDSPDHGALKVELKKYKKKARKGIGELHEERQLLANMGAALLVIVGLSAYIAYNFGYQNAKH